MVGRPEVSDGEIGEFIVAGPMVTREYFVAAMRTPWPRSPILLVALSSIGWRILGYRDDRGRPWFCGRKSHRVTIGSKTTLYTICCEGVFNAHPTWPAPRCGRSGPSGMTPVLCVEPVKRLATGTGARTRRAGGSRVGISPHEDHHVDPLPQRVPR